jgi:hypothetical protein
MRASWPEASIGEGVVNRSAVLERDHSKVSTAKLRDSTPEAESVVFLTFDPHGVLDDCHAPLAPEVGTLAKNLQFEVRRISVGGHAEEDFFM